MERFEIALSLDDKQLLIPSMLPKEKPGMQLHQLQKLIRRRANAKVCKFTAIWTFFLHLCTVRRRWRSGQFLSLQFWGSCSFRDCVHHIFIPYNTKNRLKLSKFLDLNPSRRLIRISDIRLIWQRDGNVSWRRESARKGLNTTSCAQFAALPLVKPVVWFARAVVNWCSRSVAKSAYCFRVVLF